MAEQAVVAMAATEVAMGTATKTCDRNRLFRSLHRVLPFHKASNAEVDGTATPDLHQFAFCSAHRNHL